MKNKNLGKAIIITLIILVIIFIVLLIIVGSREIKKQNTPIYSTIEEMPDVATLINQMYGEYIKMEDSQDERYFKDIYVDLKYGLYEGEESEKTFYNSLITAVAQKMNYENVRIIDEEKQIEIKIVCNTENGELIGSYINGDTNFYGHYESQKALANYKKTTVTELNIESNEINTLIQNGWNKNVLSIGEAEDEIDDYIEYANFGINIYEIDEKVFNLIFDTRYTGNIVNGIKVGESFENVISKLGNPTFGSEADTYIGYKGEDIYVFFNEDQISIYPVEKEEKSIYPLIQQYEEDSLIKKLVSGATDLWENYENYYYDEYTVDLSYPLAGIKFQFGVTENHGIIIYNNFIGKIIENYTQEELSKIEIEIPSYIYFVEDDSVNEYERERNFLIQATSEEGDYEDDEDWKYVQNKEVIL